MVTLTVEIDEQKDLPVLQALFNRMDLKYHIDNEDYQMTEAEIEGINAGLEDIEAGRVHTNERVTMEIEKVIANFRNG